MYSLSHSVCSIAIFQFTLQCVVNKGTRPDFHQAMKSEQSLPMFNKFLEVLRSKVPNSDDLVQGRSSNGT